MTGLSLATPKLALTTTLVAGLLFMPFPVQALWEVETYFQHDFPGFRFTPWNSLPESKRNLATSVGYTATTWDKVGTFSLEALAWSDLDTTTDIRSNLESLGFTEHTWDCYMNHYAGYSWIELVVKGLHKEAEMLGWTAATWDASPSGAVVVDSDNLSWEDLTKGQKRAAVALCYWEDTWDDDQDDGGGPKTLDQYSAVPAYYPWFRFQLWDYLTNKERTLAVQIGRDADSWNAVTTPTTLGSTAFADLPDETRQGLMELGFYEEQYDCWINHYEGYSWEDWVEYELSDYFAAFGFTASSTALPEAYVQYDWIDLTEDQKNAAYKLCWFQELWDEESLVEWADDDVPIPVIRFTPWDDLSSSQQLLAAQAGYDSTTWNVPGTQGSTDRKSFDELTSEQQDAMQALGFYSTDQYDCWVNHYNGYDWSELVDLGIDAYATTLGYDQGSWDGTSSPPLSEDLDWDELSEDQKEAADHFCYFYEIWDRQPLPIWQGVAWPELRYYPWSQFDTDEQDLMTIVGYTPFTWNNPETSDVEDTAWSDLSSTQREALREYGFYEDQWDCFVNHYSDYDWFELILEGVDGNFVAFGWTESTWYDGTEPDAWNYKWDDLTDAQKDAAWEICYFEETWDNWALTEWESDVVSGSGASPTSDSEDDDEDEESEDEESDKHYEEDKEYDDLGYRDKSALSDTDDSDSFPVVVTIVLIFVALIVGFVCGTITTIIAKKKRQEKEAPKEGPVVTEESVGTMTNSAYNGDFSAEEMMDNYDKSEEYGEPKVKDLHFT